MGLQKYHKKRKFDVTSEPKGRKPIASKKSKALKFYIQEHHASHLHYDFRLEMEGVLRSWAVPKGPSLDPTIKRLAVAVEDHPMEYGSFEGTIPENQYGAGRVILWDHGTWKSDRDPVVSFKKGRIDFELKGERLHGRWLLVRTNRGSGSKKQWLLMKRSKDLVDEHFDAPENDNQTEVLSKREPLPDKLEPQLARLEQQTPTGDEWAHEIKLDGYRIMTRIEGKKVRLITRGGLDWSEKFASVRDAIAKLGLKNTILDGEIVVFDDDGKSDFQALQTALSEDSKSEYRYCVFDLPFLNGNNLTAWPLKRRREHLKPLIKSSNKIVRYSESIVGEGKHFFQECCKLGLEGVISKRLDSSYTSGRGETWVKSKCQNRQEFVIGGYTDSIRPGDAFASLLLGVQEKNGLRYVGKTGTGFTARSMKTLLAKFRKLARKESPFKEAPTSKGVHWVNPKLVCEVNFATWTADKHLRQASFKGLREDKQAKAVVAEKPVRRITAKTSLSKKPKNSLAGGEPIVILSHPEKILFKKAKVTKQELADYYAAIERWIMPHIENRPLTIVRCPDGASGTCFYQRHIGTMKSKYVKETVIGKNEGGDTDRKYISVDSLEGIQTLVQIGSLELHAWNTDLADTKHPREIIFDLDPGLKVTSKQIYHCAIRLKQMLEQLKLKSFVNLSGSKGLHIHVPIARKYSWDEAKSFSHSIVKMMMERYPDDYTDNIRKNEREGRIFIDYLRNGLTSTSVIPYSVRKRDDASVALPISWKELKPNFDPAGYDIRDVQKRLKKLKSDPWKGMIGLHQKLSVLD